MKDCNVEQVIDDHLIELLRVTIKTYDDCK